MKLTTQHVTVIVGLLVFIPSILLVYSDIIFQANIDVNVKSIINKNSTTVNIIIDNNGAKPAQNLRITLNSPFDIIENKTKFYTEPISYESTGSKNLIGIMDRLANDQNIIIETKLNSTEKIEGLSVYVTHDTGSTTKHYSDNDSFDFLKNAIMILLVVMIAAFATLAVRVITDIFIQ